MQGEEKNFPIQSGITDIAHFSSSVQADGTLSDNLDLPPEVINASPDVRRHIVITAPWNSDLYHHYLNPDLPFRETIIKKLKHYQNHTMVFRLILKVSLVETELPF